jgi:hypothetical protein
MHILSKHRDSISAVRALAIGFGSWCGLSGIEHGFFEILQGNILPVKHMVGGRPMIYAIGEANRIWRYGYEYAITIIPSYSWSGILASVFGLLVIICSLTLIQKRLGWAAFIFLSTLQYLVGGGYAQYVPAVIVGLIATRIAKPLVWYRIAAPIKLLRALALPWFPLLIALIFVCLNSTVTAVTGWFYGIRNDEFAFKLQWSMLYISSGLFPLAIISALSHDSLVMIEQKGRESTDPRSWRDNHV